MRWLLIAALFLPTCAMAQTLPANVQALQQTILKLTGESLDWQTKAIELQRENDELKQKEKKPETSAK